MHVSSDPPSSSPAEGQPAPPRVSALRLLGILRWWLPLTLCATALLVEWTEHVVFEGEPVTPYFLGEVFVFALVGPVAVWFTLTWVAGLVAAYQATSAALHEVNQGLETSVAERTRHLEETTLQLEAANAHLARANEDLREIDRMKSEFVSLVSHQLRAPLTNINGALELVSQDAHTLPAHSQRTLRILAQESQRLSRLIQTILDLSRLEAGRLRLHLGPVALEPLLARTCASTLAPEVGRSWQLEAGPGLPPAWADEQLLEEVVRNLLENAARYSPADRPIGVAVELADEALQVSVIDHGPGVPVEEQSNIFRSFRRVGEVDSTVAGYGLGLYFADRLIRAMHGTIGVDSPLRPDGPEPGSRFWFRVPIARGTPDEEDDASWRAAGAT